MAKQQVRKKANPPTDQTAPAAADTPRPRRPRTTKKAVGATQAAPTFDQIAERAYHRFVERGCVPGHELEDWLAAEAELKSV